MVRRRCSENDNFIQSLFLPFNMFHFSPLVSLIGSFGSNAIETPTTNTISLSSGNFFFCVTQHKFNFIITQKMTKKKTENNLKKRTVASTTVEEEAESIVKFNYSTESVSMSFTECPRIACCETWSFPETKIWLIFSLFSSLIKTIFLDKNNKLLMVNYGVEKTRIDVCMYFFVCVLIDKSFSIFRLQTKKGHVWEHKSINHSKAREKNLFGKLELLFLLFSLI